MAKKKPDFSMCKDPEFAEILWNRNQVLIERQKNNPLLKVLNDKRRKEQKK